MVRTVQSKDLAQPEGFFIRKTNEVVAISLYI
jgi:hypothetical protein